MWEDKAALTVSKLPNTSLTQWWLSESPLELSEEAAKEGEANVEDGIFPKSETLTRNHVIELKEMVGPSTPSNSKAQSIHKNSLSQSWQEVLR